MIFVICILGVALIAYARQSQEQVSALDTAKQNYYTAFGIYKCDDFVGSLPAVQDVGADAATLKAGAYIESAGVIRWEPQVLSGERRANLQTIFDLYGLEVTNDSNISLTITDYYFDLYLNGVKVGSVANASVNQYLNKNGGKSFVPMRIKIATTEFLKGDVVLGLIDSVKESTLQQKGYFGVKKGLFKFKNIPVDFTYKLKEFM